MINFKFLLRPHQQYYITQYEELGFPQLTQMKDDFTTNSHYLIYTFLFRKVGRMYFLNLMRYHRHSPGNCHTFTFVHHFCVVVAFVASICSGAERGIDQENVRVCTCICRSNHQVTKQNPYKKLLKFLSVHHSGEAGLGNAFYVRFTSSIQSHCYVFARDTMLIEFATLLVAVSSPALCSMLYTLCSITLLTSHTISCISSANLE